MLIREEKWELIRHLFSEEEKEILRGFIIGESICPRGWILDQDALPQSLEVKLKGALNA